MEPRSWPQPVRWLYETIEFGPGRDMRNNLGQWRVQVRRIIDSRWQNLKCCSEWKSEEMKKKGNLYFSSTWIILHYVIMRTKYMYVLVCSRALMTTKITHQRKHLEFFANSYLEQSSGWEPTCSVQSKTQIMRREKTLQASHLVMAWSRLSHVSIIKNAISKSGKIDRKE